MGRCRPWKSDSGVLLIKVENVGSGKDREILKVTDSLELEPPSQSQLIGFLGKLLMALFRKANGFFIIAIIHRVYVPTISSSVHIEII